MCGLASTVSLCTGKVYLSKLNLRTTGTNKTPYPSSKARTARHNYLNTNTPRNQSTMDNLIIASYNSKYSLRRSPLWPCINLLRVGKLIHYLTEFV